MKLLGRTLGNNGAISLIALSKSLLGPNIGEGGVEYDISQ